MKKNVWLIILILIPYLLFPIGEDQYQKKYMNEVVPYYESGYFGTFSGTGGIRINYAFFEAPEEQGALVILPGIPESYIKYAELVYDLRNTGFSIYIMDHRGVGFSGRMLEDPEKIYVKRYTDYVDDLGIFMDTVVNAKEHEKLFMIGHSSGGQTGALYLSEHQDLFSGAVFSSPLFKVNTGNIPGWVARPLLAILVTFGGGKKYAFGQGEKYVKTFEGNPLTHSRERWSMWEKYILPQHPEIQSAGYTLRWAQVNLKGAAKARRAAKKITLPVLLLEAEEDEFTLPKGRDIFCRRAQNCTRRLFPGSRHELFIEKDEIRDEVIAEIIGFIER